VSIRPQEFCSNFKRALQRLDGTRRRLESLHNQIRISRADVERLYSGLYVSAVTTFEGFLEELFVGIVTGKILFPARKVRSKLQFRSSPEAISIICGERNYVDWLPYQETLKRAMAYLNGGRPFSNLEQPEQQKLVAIHQIRNAIAHASDYAMGIFEKKIIANHVLLPRERTPAAFLRTPIGAPGGPTRFEAYLGDLSQCAQQLC
jgi:hypothetical protein